MSQNHFTVHFPWKSPADAKALAEQLPPLMPEIFQAQDAIGTIHYSRFTVLSEKTLLFIGDFDGEFSQVMTELAKNAGPVFDAISQHVVDPPPTPVPENAGAFVEWTADHLLTAVNLYTAYPGVTVLVQPRKMSLAACIRRWPSTTRYPWFAYRLLPRGDSSTDLRASLTCRKSGSSSSAKSSVSAQRVPTLPTPTTFTALSW